MSNIAIRMIKAACMTALACVTPAMAQQLDYYDEIKAAIMKGKSIRIMLNYDKCANSSSWKITGNSYAAYTPNAIAVDSNGIIHASIMNFTMYDGLFPGKPVYEYANYAIDKDNSLSVTWKVLNAADYSQLGNDFTTSCKIGESAIVFSTQDPARAETGISEIG